MLYVYNLHTTQNFKNKHEMAHRLRAKHTLVTCRDFVTFNNNIVIDLLLINNFNFQVSGTISNTGHSVIFTVDNDTRHHINVTGGPLSYKYQFQEIHVHYGLHDQFGSEHSINGYAFPAEVSTHFEFYNKLENFIALLQEGIDRYFFKY